MEKKIGEVGYLARVCDRADLETEAYFGIVSNPTTFFESASVPEHVANGVSLPTAVPLQILSPLTPILPPGQGSLHQACFQARRLVFRFREGGSRRHFGGSETEP